MKKEKSFLSPSENNLGFVRNELLSAVEPFLEFDIELIREKLIDDMIVRRYRSEIIEILNNLSIDNQINSLVNILASTKAEIHYLKAAYLERLRYQEKKFDIKMPNLIHNKIPDILDLDMRCDLTGSGWHEAEEDGRWAGSESHASLSLPALGTGEYLMELFVIAESDAGIIDSMQTHFNRYSVLLARIGEGFPCKLTAIVKVLETYKLPFWTIKFELQRTVSPSEHGSEDYRKLAIKLERVRFTKIDNAKS